MPSKQITLNLKGDKKKQEREEGRAKEHRYLYPDIVLDKNKTKTEFLTQFFVLV
jgi:hypothetical protein